MQKLNIKDKNLYYIGGVVRDELLNTPCFDTDLTYQGDAIEFCRKLEAEGVGKIIQINSPFGTAKMLINGCEVDIASTRNEIYPQKGHLPVVSELGCELEKDVLRRDFTINSMAKSTLTGEIVDFTGGKNDLNNKMLRILHDGSFIDDPTRIVRGLKFSVRFGFELEEHTKLLQDEYLKNVNYDMSYKRLKKEFMETFNLNKQSAFEKFEEQKIYKLLTDKKVKFPKYNIEVLINKYPVENIWLVYLGWLDDIEKLPLTRKEQKIVNDYRELISEPTGEDDYSVYKVFNGKETEAVLLYIINNDEKKGLRYLSLKEVKISLTGEDLISLGIKPSKEFSLFFDYLVKYKIENSDITRDDEIRIAKDYFKL